jgi:prevent-host-death family protein
MLGAKAWQLQEAKNRFSEVIKMAANAPQSITLRGEPVAVVISMQSYKKLIKPEKSLMELLMSAPESLAGLELPLRKETLIRDTAL